MQQTQTSTTATATQSRASLYRAQPYRCSAEWDWGEPHIRAALEQDADLTLAQVRAEVFAREMQLWLVDYGQKGAVVTQVLEGQAGKLCLIVACGGRDISVWLSLLSEIEDWAREQDCVEMRIIGRRGWKRMLARRDYHETGIVLAREL